MNTGNNWYSYTSQDPSTSTTSTAPNAFAGQHYPYPMSPHAGMQSNSPAPFSMSSTNYYPPPNPTPMNTYNNPSFQANISWKEAFGIGTLEGEPPLFEELGVNFDHMKTKSLSVLNPFRTIDKHIMDDTDLAGPIFFCLLLGIFLFLSGKVHFGFIYGFAMLGCLSMYLILNVMSETGIDGYRTASVLGYCLLPMVFLSSISIFFPLEKNLLGFMAGAFAVLWCTFASSAMFVSVLSMKEQRILIMYPIGLLYTCFGLMTIF